MSYECWPIYRGRRGLSIFHWAYMSIDMERRRYTLKKRAESQEATRERIVEALMRLHEEVGPKNASISAIAERAGVRRMTVYRHFPSETELFSACTSRWLEINPPPDPNDWAGYDRGLERCQAALRALYSYYRATQRMWEVSYRDEAEVPALQGPMHAFRDYLAAISADILSKFPGRNLRDVAATVEHAVQFQTWRSLSATGLDDKEAARLATKWAAAAVKG